MNEWRCEIVTAEGHRDWRRILAQSADDAAVQLLAEGATPVRVTSGPMSLAERLRQPVALGNGLNEADQAMILGQLAMLLRAGLAVDRALDLLADQMPRRGQRDWLRRALRSVRSGDTLARALEAGDYLPGWALGVIRSAEQAGHLADGLAALAARIDQSAKARRDLVTALTYPAVVVAATLVALLVVLVLVVPQFESMLRSNADQLPMLTRIVLWLSVQVRALGWWLVAALVLLAMGGVHAVRAGWLDSTANMVGGRIGLLGLRNRFLAARFASLLSTLLANGMALVPALPYVRDAMGSRRWREAIDQLAVAVREGKPLTEALRAEPLFPLTAVRLIEVGERGGTLAARLADTGTILHASASAQLQRMIALANPIAILLLGVLVALLVAGVLLGIFSVGEFTQ